MGLPQTEIYPPQIQTAIQIGSFALCILIMGAVVFILHYYRAAFKPPTNSASTEAKLAS